jgi:hypothetical protein
MVFLEQQWYFIVNVIDIPIITYIVILITIVIVIPWPRPPRIGRPFASTISIYNIQDEGGYATHGGNSLHGTAPLGTPPSNVSPA